MKDMVDLKMGSIFANIRWAWQRVMRGWDDRAVWSLDYYFSKLIPEVVTELKEREKGVPTAMFDEGDWDDDNYCYREGAVDKATIKWNAILDDIAEGFARWNEIMDDCGNPDEDKKVNRAFDLFREHYGSLWW